MTDGVHIIEGRKRSPRKGETYRGARRTTEKRREQLAARRLFRRQLWRLLGLTERLAEP